eukprot:Clim_evm19s203 gene=Clim_evmTU19s203
MVVTTEVTGTMKAGAAAFYGVASLVIVFANKWTLTSWGFPSSMALAIGQGIITLIALQLLKRSGQIEFQDYSHRVFKKVWPLPLIFMGNQVTGLGGTKAISIPMFTVLRRFSIWMIMVAEQYIQGIEATYEVKMSVAGMILGAVVAAADDLSFDAWGYTIITINNVFTALYGAVLKQKLDSKDLGTFGLIYYNTFFSLPILIVIYFMIPGEHEKVMQFEYFGSLGFQLCFILSCILGAVLNYSIFLCTSYNSALTTSVVGCLKNVLSTYFGMLISPDYVFSVINFLGINISILGSLYYSYIKYVEANQKRDNASLPKPQATGYAPVPGKDIELSGQFESPVVNGDANDDDSVFNRGK